MEPQHSSDDEREIRAARNQSLFRAVNEQIRTMNEALATATESLAIACECFDTNCIKTLEISPDEYRAIRAEPRHFAVLPGHLDPEVEDVVRESDRFVVVEKTATAGVMAEALDPRQTG